MTFTDRNTMTMMDLKNYMKRMEHAENVRDAKGKYAFICPSSRGVFITTNGDAIAPLSDIIEERDFNLTGSMYSIVVPGLMEWYERYQQYVNNPTVDFDWKSWHRDGLLFSRYIYNNLPRIIELKYVTPLLDNSKTVKSFDVTEERLNLFLNLLKDHQQEREPIIKDSVVVGVKDEDGQIVIRFKVKGKYAPYTYRMSYDQLKSFITFMESIAISEYEPSPWESHALGMYFYPQIIGDFHNMGQLHIYTEGKLVFYAYINSRDFIRSVYRSIKTHISSNSKQISSNEFQSELLEYYIDNDRYEQSVFRLIINKFAELLRKAFSGSNRYFKEIYESLLDEDETI